MVGRTSAGHLSIWSMVLTFNWTVSPSSLLRDLLSESCPRRPDKLLQSPYCAKDTHPVKHVSIVCHMLVTQRSAMMMLL